MALDIDKIENEFMTRSAPRSPIIAFLLALLSPGLGWTYLGRLAAGVAINSLASSIALSFVLAWTVLKFYPVVPLAVIIAGWAIIVVLNALDILRLARRDGARYELRDCNHPLVYASVLVFSYLLPVFGIWELSGRFIWSIETVADQAMYPTLQTGDRVLVDRTAYRAAGPRRGDVVVYTMNSGEVRASRVVGLASEVIVLGDSLFLNDLPAIRSEIEPEFKSVLVTQVGKPGEGTDLWIEQIGAKSESSPAFYVSDFTSFWPAERRSWQVGYDQVFTLNDNRTNEYDSRTQGGIDRDAVQGRALFVAPTRESRQTGVLATLDSIFWSHGGLAAVLPATMPEASR